jgi:branched-chain amino acid transport system permease protein
MDLVTFLQQIINSFSLGSMYALIAIGYTMVYGVLRLINFAHGDIMMVGVYFAFFAMSVFALPFGFAVIVAVGGAVVVGILIDKIAYKPLRKAPRISLLITAIGMSFFLENIVNVLYGSTPIAFSVPDFFSQTYDFSGVIVTPTVIIVPIVTLILMMGILYILYRTKYGMAIRALAFDVETVKLMGIDANKIIMLVFAVGSGLAAVGGVFWGINYPTIEPLMGVLIGLKAFAAAVLGGIGSVVGALLGGLILGFTEVLFVAFMPEYGGYKDAIAFIFLILVLLFRPAGIMGINFEKARF